MGVTPIGTKAMVIRLGHNEEKTQFEDSRSSSRRNAANWEIMLGRIQLSGSIIG
jgi:hypothetical protein